MNKIREIFERHGEKDYIGEEVTQLEHALQTAHIAEENGEDNEMILAALLHDIGHLVIHDACVRMGGFGITNHEKIGANYLRDIGIGGDIPELVESHVISKRWLCRGKDYYEKLSEASKRTLVHQGGPLSDEEAEEYLKHPLHARFTQLRLYDDAAKVVGKKTDKRKTLDEYLSLFA